MSLKSPRFSARAAIVPPRFMTIVSTPDLSPDAAISELAPILRDPNNWKDLNQEASLKSKLIRIIERLNRLAVVKRCGVAGVPDERKQEALSLLKDLQEQGIFVVPRGALESWVPTLTTTSRENKALWATEAAQKIEDAGRCPNDIWDFGNGIVVYIVKRLAESVSAPQA